MDRRAFDERRRTVTMKAAGKRIQNSLSKFGELHMTKTDVARYKETKRVAESEQAEAESELSMAKKTVKALAMQIEESSSRVRAENKHMEPLKKLITQKDKPRSDETFKYADVIREMEFVKQELCKLKLDMARLLEEKLRAEKEIEGANSKLKSSLSTKESLKKEIEEANEEQVLVELARIEALKELGEIEDQRDREAIEFSAAMEEKQNRIKNAMEEIELSKEFESKLAVTLSDVDVLQSQLRLVRKMEDGMKQKDSMESNSIIEELEAAKKELVSVKREGFQFMALMDTTRNELKRVTDELAESRNTQVKVDLTVQILNSKLLRLKSKLEAVTAAEEKSKSILSNLLVTLQQLNTEAEVAKKEKELVTEETANIKEEIKTTESEMEVSEERLQAAMQELEAVKSSEALAFDKLQSLIEKTMRARASASDHTSTISISKFEYDYLTGRAAAAETIADKKVAAAQAWIEAIKASEREIFTKIETAQREIKEIRVEEEKEVYTTARQLSAKRAVEGELKNWRRKREKSSIDENWQPTQRKKSMKANNGTSTPSRKVPKSASPAHRTPRPTPFPMRKRTKVVPSFTKIFNGKRNYKAQ